MTQSDFIEYLKEVIDLEYEGKQRLFATAKGITESYLSDVLSGKRAPGLKICKAVGFTRVVSYEYQPGE